MKLLNARLSPWIVVPVLAVIVWGTYGFVDEKSEKEANRLAGAQTHQWNMKECSSCHREAETIRMMQSKRGDPSYRSAELKALLAAAKDHPASKPGKYKAGW